jgi:hypothetical protein
MSRDSLSAAETKISLVVEQVQMRGMEQNVSAERFDAADLISDTAREDRFGLRFFC